MFRRLAIAPRFVCVLLGLALAIVSLTNLSWQRVFAAALTSGDVVTYRVGTGIGSLVNTGNAVFLDEYHRGTLVQSIALPTTGSGTNRRLIASGTPHRRIAHAIGRRSLSDPGRI